MRNWDNWNRYLDNNSKPLRGCVMFNVKDGNTVAPIFDSDGTALDNPQLTDNYGRTGHQVFIDSDVVAYFYKYIGTGEFNTFGSESYVGDIDINDDTLWSLQYTSENINDVLKHVVSDSVVSVGTMTELRGLDVTDVPEVYGKKIITLLGYNTVGDKEPINYIWNPESTVIDNGGSVIKSDDLITGRWIMVQPTEHVDSRHFGAFPSNSSNMADQSYQIGQLFAYCDEHDLKPFFNGSTDYRWFKYTNINVIADIIDVTDNTYFNDLGNNYIQGEWNGNPYFYNGNTNVVAKNIKASWNAKTYTGYKNVLLDIDCPQKTWQDADVEITFTPCYGYNFVHCDLSENANIGSENASGINNTFQNCKLNERMFITSGDYVVSLNGLCTNCQVDMDDFRNNMWLYKEIRLTSDSDAFFDYRNFPNVGKPINNYTANKVTSDAVWITNLKNMMNVRYDLDTLGGTVNTFYLENCIGYYNVPAGVNLVITNCTLKLRVSNNVNLDVHGGSVEIDDNWNANSTMGNVQLWDTTLTGNSETLYKTINLSARNSTLNIKMDVTGSGAYYNTVIAGKQYCAYADVKDCNIGAEFMLYGVDGDQINVPQYNDKGEVLGYWNVTRFVNGTFKDNYVSGKIIIGSHIDDSHYASNWLARGLSITNNTGLVPGAITVYRGYATIDDDYNIYTYEDNKGTMKFEQDFTCSVQAGQWTPGTANTLAVAANNTTIFGYTNESDTAGYIFQTTFFSIGTINTKIKYRCMPLVIPSKLEIGAGAVNYAKSGNNYTYGIIKNVSGFTWRIRCCTVSNGSYSSNMSNFIVHLEQL